MAKLQRIFRQPTRGPRVSLPINRTSSRIFDELTKSTKPIFDDIAKRRGEANASTAQSQAGTSKQVSRGGFTTFDKVFNQAAEAQFNTNVKNEVDRVVIDLREQFVNDPDGFNKEFDKRTSPFLEAATTGNQPNVRAYLDATRNRIFGQLRGDQFARQRSEFVAGEAARIDADIDLVKQGIVSGDIDPETGSFLQPNGQLVDDTISSITRSIQTLVDQGLDAGRGQTTLAKLNDDIRRAEITRAFNETDLDTQTDFALALIENDAKAINQFGVSEDLRGSLLNPEQRAALGNTLLTRVNKRRSAQSGERQILRDEMTALHSLALRGQDVTFGKAATKLLDAGEDEETVERLVSKGQFNKRVGQEIRAFGQGTVSDFRNIAQQSRIDAENFSGSAIEREREFQRSEAIIQAYSQQQRLIGLDNGWTAFQQNFSGEFDDFDFSTPQGVKAAQVRIADQFGIAQPGPPPALVQGLQTAYNAAQTAEERVGILTGQQIQYGDLATDIIDAADIGAAARIATQTAHPLDRQNLDLAEANWENNKGLIEDKADVVEQFRTDFPATTISDPEQRKMFEDAYTQLWASALFNSHPDPAKFARDTLLSGRRVATIGGTDLLVEEGVDVEAINSTIEDMRRDPLKYGLANEGLTNSAMKTVLSDGTIIPVYRLGKIFLKDTLTQQVLSSETATGRQAFTIMRDGTVSALPDGSNVAESDVWDGATVSGDARRTKKVTRQIRGRLQPDTREVDITTTSDRAQKAHEEAEANGLSQDLFANALTRSPARLLQLNGISHVIKGGEIPDWVVDFLLEGDFDEFNSLRRGEVKTALKEAWADEAQRKQLNLNNRQMTPLESLTSLMSRIELETPPPTRPASIREGF